MVPRAVCAVIRSSSHQAVTTSTLVQPDTMTNKPEGPHQTRGNLQRRRLVPPEPEPQQQEEAWEEGTEILRRLLQTRKQQRTPMLLAPITYRRVRAILVERRRSRFRSLRPSTSSSTALPSGLPRNSRITSPRSAPRNRSSSTSRTRTGKTKAAQPASS